MNVDASDVHTFTRKSLRAFDRMPGDVFGFVEAGAKILVQTDPYQNRTGDLRASTLAINYSDDVDAWEFSLNMETEYASYVRDRGFSRIDEVYGVVAQEIFGYLTVTMPSNMGA